MTDSVPKVSVCVPCYNAASFIGRTIESVLAQTSADWELVIVDDASTDGTTAVIAGYVDDRIRYIRNETNVGVAENWTRAVDAGRGPYRKVLCHDDLIYPRSLEMQAAVLDDPANADVVLVSASRDIIDEAGRVVIRDRKAKTLRGRVAGDAAIRAIVRSGTNPLGEPGALLFRADAYARGRPFLGRSVWMIDIDMWSRLLGGGGLYVLPDTLSAFRISPTALSTTLAHRQSVETYRLFRQLRHQHPAVVRRQDLLVGRVRAAVFQRLRRLVYGIYLRRA